MLVQHTNLKTGKVFTSEFVGTGPSSFKKKNLPGRGLTKVEKHFPKAYITCLHGTTRKNKNHTYVKLSCFRSELHF